VIKKTMDLQTAWQDLETRENQLRLHIIRSEEYLRQFDRDFKRQVLMLYLCIALILLFQSWFFYQSAMYSRWDIALFVLGISVLAVGNCMLLIRTKMFLNRINEAWIEPQEKIALNNLRAERYELIQKLSQPKAA